MSRKRKRRKRKNARKGNNSMSAKVNGAKVSSLDANRKCSYHPLRQIFSIKAGEGALWAGSQDTVKSNVNRGIIQPTFVIELAGTDYSFAPEWPIQTNDVGSEVLPAELLQPNGGTGAVEPAILYIDWDDGGVPVGLSKQWWEALAAYVRQIKGDGIVCCIGGHGRTGTVLAILSVLLGFVGEDEDPVSWVRDKYCHSAVETNSQILYIEQITGRRVHEAPSDNWWVGAYGHSSSVNAGTASSPTVRELFADQDEEDVARANGYGSSSGVYGSNNSGYGDDDDLYLRRGV